MDGNRTAPLSKGQDLWAALLVAVGVFALIGLRLTTGHPFEDAYILFTYVEHAVSGHGIVYYRGGPAAEGFTDTLWFALLVAVSGLGVDVGWAAASVSAASAAVIAWVLLQVTPAGWPWRLLLGAWLMTFHGTQASLGGFGCLFFCAFAALAWLSLWRRSVSLQLWMLALLPLVRLEGWAVGGVLFAALCVQQRDRHVLWIGGVVALCVPLGILTWWRFHHFGSALPLPALVKGGGEELFPGLSSNFAWLRREVGPLPWLVLTAILVAVARPSRCGAGVVAALPGLGVLLPLLLAEQMQNVRWRFQAPATLAVVLLALAMLAGVWAGATPKRRRWLLVAACCACAPSLWVGGRQLSRGWNLGADLFGPRLAPRLIRVLGPDATLATTEAGVLAFRQRCRVVDLVGLNSAAFARQTMRVADLERLAPDLLVCNSYGVLEVEGTGLEPGVEEVVLRSSDLRQRRAPAGRVRLRSVTGACLDYLVAHPEYEVRGVREGRNLLIFGIKPGLRADPEFAVAWKAARDAAGGRSGYFDSWPEPR